MLKVDIRNRVLDPKLGEVIKVISERYTTTVKTVPYYLDGCEKCAFHRLNCCGFVRCSKHNRATGDDVMFKVIERKITKEVENE